MTRSAKAVPTFLYLHKMDEEDLAHYYSRLKQLHRIIDEAPDVFETADGTVIFHEPLAGNLANEVNVKIAPLSDGGPDGVIVWTKLQNGKSDFCICEPLRHNLSVDLKNDDDIFNLVTLWLSEADQAFSRQGHIGKHNLQEVEKRENDAFNLLNALVHAYIELNKEDEFIVEISIGQPYRTSRFCVIDNDEPFEFLTDRTRDKIAAMMPSVVRLESTRQNGITTYSMREMESQRFTITAADLPEEAEFRKTLNQLRGIEEPHLLDEFVPA